MFTPPERNANDFFARGHGGVLGRADWQSHGDQRPSQFFDLRSGIHARRGKKLLELPEAFGKHLLLELGEPGKIARLA